MRKTIFKKFAICFPVSAFRKLGFRGTHSIQTRQQGEKMQVQKLLKVYTNRKSRSIIIQVFPCLLFCYIIEICRRFIQIQILPALSDNYMYLLVDEKSKETAVVDPVEPDTVLRYAVPSTRGGRPTTSISSPNHILIIFSSEPHRNPRPFNKVSDP